MTWSAAAAAFDTLIINPVLESQQQQETENRKKHIFKRKTKLK